MPADQKKNRKKIAAIAAVMQYLQVESGGEQLSAGLTTALVAVALPDRTKMPAAALWGTSGRQAQMQMRIMVQMKTFR